MSRRRERGSASIELVGLLPLVIIFLVMVLQVFATVYAAQGASQAARDAARAYSKTDSLAQAEAAARDSLPGGVTLVPGSLRSSGMGHGVRLTVETPRVVNLLGSRITRTVVMP